MPLFDVSGRITCTKMASSQKGPKESNVGPVEGLTVVVDEAG
jgi:hypothetical protein